MIFNTKTNYKRKKLLKKYFNELSKKKVIIIKTLSFKNQKSVFDWDVE